MDVIVTDHHQPGEQLPDCPILHPALDGYPFDGALRHRGCLEVGAVRSGAGSDSRESGTRRLSDLDWWRWRRSPMWCRSWGRTGRWSGGGWSRCGGCSGPGIRALVEAAKCEPTRLDEGDLAFKLAPRINAAGRLYRADAGVELFLTEDPGAGCRDRRRS